MFSDEYILSLIKKYAQTPNGKAEIAKKKSGKFVANWAPNDNSGLTESRARKIGEDMKDILFEKISSVIKSFKKEDIIVSVPRLEQGKYSLSISFNEDALRRESLDPGRYPEGVTNVVKLFITGYDARASVHGVWKTHGNVEIDSLTHREPNDFMEIAVAEFNNKYTGVAVAKTSNGYKSEA